LRHCSGVGAGREGGCSTGAPRGFTHSAKPLTGLTTATSQCALGGAASCAPFSVALTVTQQTHKALAKDAARHELK